ncbi:MAG: sensor histidine kinase [Bacteriovoracia bacterium]
MAYWLKSAANIWLQAGVERASAGDVKKAKILNFSSLMLFAAVCVAAPIFYCVVGSRIVFVTIFIVAMMISIPVQNRIGSLQAASWTMILSCNVFLAILVATDLDRTVVLAFLVCPIFALVYFDLRQKYSIAIGLILPICFYGIFWYQDRVASTGLTVRAILELVNAYNTILVSFFITFYFYLTNSRNEQKLKEESEKLLKAQSQLIHTSKMAALGEMAGGIAHEINNPLGVICLKAEQLSDLLDDNEIDEAKSAAEKIKEVGFRIAKIITGLRSVAKDASQIPLERYKLKDVLEDSLGLCRERFKFDGIEIHSPMISEDLVIECRVADISQVLLSLLKNSHDAICDRPEKWIKIEVVENEDLVEISVVDSGHGISRDIQERMMQPFFTTKEIGKGMGLGLSTSRAIVEVHNGKLFYDASSPNTRFVIVLPKSRLTQDKLSA